MSQWFLLDWVDAVARSPSVSGQVDPIAAALAHEAEPALFVEQLAGARTESAFEPSVLEGALPAAPLRFTVIS